MLRASPSCFPYTCGCVRANKSIVRTGTVLESIVQYLFPRVESRSDEYTAEQVRVSSEILGAYITMSSANSDRLVTRTAVHDHVRSPLEWIL